MSEKYTAGPWRIAGTATGYITNNGKGGRIQVAVVGAYDDKELLPFNKERWDADARLIAAAPDLYEALKAHQEWSDKEDAGPQYPVGTTRKDPGGEDVWRAWWEEQLALCDRAQKLTRTALSKAATP